MWDLASLSPDQATTTTTSAASGCVGRFPLPCGAGPVAWVAARPDDGQNTAAAAVGATANSYAKPLLCIGCDDGCIQVLAWDAKKKSLTKFVSGFDRELLRLFLRPSWNSLSTLSCALPMPRDFCFVNSTASQRSALTIDLSLT